MLREEALISLTERAVEARNSGEVLKVDGLELDVLLRVLGTIVELNSTIIDDLEAEPRFILPEYHWGDNVYPAFRYSEKSKPVVDILQERGFYHRSDITVFICLMEYSNGESMSIDDLRELTKYSRGSVYQAINKLRKHFDLRKFSLKLVGSSEEGWKIVPAVRLKYDRIGD